MPAVLQSQCGQTVSLDFTTGRPFPLKLPIPMEESGSHLTHDSLHRWPQSVPILYNGTPLPPSKLPLPMGDLDPHLIYGSRGPPESSTQMASWSVQPFLQGSLVWQADATRSVTIDHIYVHSTHYSLGESAPHATGGGRPPNAPLRGDMPEDNMYVCL